MCGSFSEHVLRNYFDLRVDTHRLVVYPLQSLLEEERRANDKRIVNKANFGYSAIENTTMENYRTLILAIQ